VKKIEMVDLFGQYEAIKTEIQAAIDEVLTTAHFIGGPVVTRFQQSFEAYLKVKHVIPCANGTDALQIALMALGLKPGDEVITPSFTYIATTEVIALLGLKPVFVDVDPNTFCIDPSKIERAITPQTKAIVPVHLYGQAADMETIMQLAKKHQLAVVEDNAQGIGGDYYFNDGTTAKLGTIGDIGCTSFFPSKNLGCYGDGGAMYTNNSELAERLKMIANHGQKQKYYHEIVGCNSRLDAIQAAVLNVKLPRLDTYIAARRKVADRYDEILGKSDNIIVPKRTNYSKHVFHQYTIQLVGLNRDDLQVYLAEKGIPSMIYYPKPAHKQPMFASFQLGELDLPVTETLTASVISLPIHTEMTAEQQQLICTEVLNFISIIK
jgi:UDP-2-acetamido-2-deoxy-ribo-hexuluronate aminotransferase